LLSDKHREKMQKRAEKEMAKALAGRLLPL
jgi:hypothetical protein